MPSLKKLGRKHGFKVEKGIGDEEWISRDRL
jgi:hypothetical protein